MSLTKDQCQPLFPQNILLFPGEQETVHFFEPRFKQLFNDCLDKHKGFGIPLFNKINTRQFGSFVSIVEVIKQYKDGKTTAVVECESNFKLQKYAPKYPGKKYPGGKLLPVNLDNETPLSLKTLERFQEFLMIETNAYIEVFQLQKMGLVDVVKTLDLPLVPRIKFMEKSNFSRMQSFISHHIRYMNLIYKQELNEEHNFFMN